MQETPGTLIFDNIDFSENPLAETEYENCVFSICNFANVDLSHIVFSECEFRGCNFSVTNLNNTAMREIKFSDCKLLGLHFDVCKQMLFEASFENCILNMSSFFRMKLKNTKFINCSMHEVDLAEADLSGALFENCDLELAVFDHTNIEKADLRTAYNYTIDPEINKVKKAKFSPEGLSGLLMKYDLNIDR